jgi:asparagine synthase (glutamine-hydrolysing)
VFVDAVVGQGGLEPHSVRGDCLSPLRDIDRALWHLDEAFAAPNLYLHWALYGAARDHGVRCLLDGIDGDTTVSHGLERFAHLVRGGRTWTLARELRVFSRRYGVGVGGVLWQFGVEPLLPVAMRLAARRIRHRGTGAWMDEAVIRSDFARRIGLVERVEAAERKQLSPPRSSREAHRRALDSALIPLGLEMADKAAAAFGIEPRYPFFDRRLMELCLSFPCDQKLSNGWTRLVMRRAMDGLLPDQVQWRRDKANLGPNFLRQFIDRDHDLVREVVFEQASVLEDYVDIQSLRRLYARYVAAPTSETEALALYRVVVLGLWLQRVKLSA